MLSAVASGIERRAGIADSNLGMPPRNRLLSNNMNGPNPAGAGRRSPELQRTPSPSRPKTSPMKVSRLSSQQRIGQDEAISAQLLRAKLGMHVLTVSTIDNPTQSAAMC
eukprot:scaffold285507_cov39-Prasinocladus_malaysianus.AAC.1